MMTDYDHLLKIVVTGDSAVGKTCMLSRFTDDCFDNTYISTIGVDFKVKCVEIDNTIVKLQIWDTAGQERFKVLVSSYYRNTGLVFIVFDLGSRESFSNISKWYDEVKQRTLEGTKIMLVGCKSDLRWAVTRKEIAMMAEQYDMPWCVCSACNGSGVEEVFKMAVRICIDTLKKNRISDTNKQMALTLKTNRDRERVCSCTIL